MYTTEESLILLHVHSLSLCCVHASKSDFLCDNFFRCNPDIHHARPCGMKTKIEPFCFVLFQLRQYLKFTTYCLFPDNSYKNIKQNKTTGGPVTHPSFFGPFENHNMKLHAKTQSSSAIFNTVFMPPKELWEA